MSPRADASARLAKVCLCEKDPRSNSFGLLRARQVSLPVLSSGTGGLDQNYFCSSPRARTHKI